MSQLEERINAIEKQVSDILVRLKSIEADMNRAKRVDPHIKYQFGDPIE